MKTLEIIIPFQGFYETLHGQLIDDANSSLVSDNDGNTYTELVDKLWLHTTTAPYIPYAKIYVEEFNNTIKAEMGYDLQLGFSELVSPKEYNFSTDVIVCKIPISSVTKMRDSVTDNVLGKLIKDKFTSCDGFCSFYSNELRGWPIAITEWNSNQLGTLLEAWVMPILEDDISMDSVVYGYGDFYGAAQSAVDSTLSPELIALSNKALQMREDGVTA